MAQKDAFKPPPYAQSLDLSISSVLISERLIGELLGWDLVDWSAIAPHRNRRFFFQREPKKGPSIYGQLKPLFDRCNPIRNDFSALKPSPIVNASLTKLVGCLCHHIGEQELAMPDKSGSPFSRRMEQDRLHLSVVERVLERMEADPLLEERAGVLRQIAAAAESELEKHFVDRINDRLEHDHLRRSALNASRIKALRQQARHQARKIELLDQQAVIGLSRRDLVLDEAALIRIEMAKILLGCFPYVSNYELMLLAELAMLQRPLSPRFLPERMLSAKGGRVDRALIERWDKSLASVNRCIDPLWSSREAPSQEVASWADRTIAICGSGPLPMSAVFFHLLTDARIILIDHDQDAVERSRRLIANLERLDVLGQGAMTVLRLHAGDVTFRDAHQPSNAASGDTVVCDAVMIASLVDATSKASIAGQFATNSDTPELLIMRSATGLTAKLAYEALPSRALCLGRLIYCGQSVPATQIASHIDRPEAIRRHVDCMATPDVLAIADPDVVNTTEVYRRIAFDDLSTLDVGDDETIESLAAKLESVARRSAV